jgi:hypothetical protein
VNVFEGDLLGAGRTTSKPQKRIKRKKDMLKKEEVAQQVRSFKSRFGIDASDENLIVSMHLSNVFGIDKDAAFDQSSRGANDNGIDGWNVDSDKYHLTIIQSKFTENKSIVLTGLKNLLSAKDWLEQVIIDKVVEKLPDDNHCLYNLYLALSKNLLNIKLIDFQLLSLFDANELEDSSLVSQFESELVSSKLNSYMRKNDGGLNFKLSTYILNGTLPREIKEYSIEKIADSEIKLRPNARLDLSYVPLYGLIELYRQRGDILFDKNVRLSLMGSKEAKARLVSPLMNTLEQIVTGELSPNIFPFYHIGVTIAANTATETHQSILNLQKPSIINGCQTISIANEFLKNLERKNDKEKIDLFRKIKVIAKVVVGVSDDELREITNSNNRQNPIENWQLFSNEPIHIIIEDSLKQWGIFYERQKGKFDTIMKNTQIASSYTCTNGTYIEVQGLAQLIALAQGNTQWIAKSSEVFARKENHEKIFSREVSKYPKDMVALFNLFKASKRALSNYLSIPTHQNDYTQRIYQKPIIKAHVYYLTCLYFYQNRFEVCQYCSNKLFHKANPTTVSDMESFLQKVVTKIKNWYLEESKELSVEISKKRMDSFFDNLAYEVKIDKENGPIPFSETSINNQLTDYAIQLA